MKQEDASWRPRAPEPKPSKSGARLLRHAKQVFAAWSDAKLMAWWFARGAKRPATKVIEADARPGGAYRIEVMGEKLYRGWGTYREVRPPERLVFTWNCEHLDITDSLITVDFRALGGSNFTEVTLTQERLPEEELEAHRKAWSECFEALERFWGESFQRLDGLLDELKNPGEENGHTTR